MYDSPDIMQASDFLGVSPAQFLSDIGLMKAGTKKRKNPGIATGVPHVQRGFDELGSYSYSSKGVREHLPPIPPHILRETERKNPIVSACTNLRVRQVRQFARPSIDTDEPGFCIKLRDADAKPSKKEKDEIRRVEDWFYETGSLEFPEADDREDSLLDVLTKLVREIMIIDTIAIEIRRDKKGDPVDFWVRDAATIRRVKDSGFTGTKNDINPESSVASSNDYYKKLTKDRKKIIPNFEDIRFVQEIQGRYVAGFTRQDLVFATFNKRTDLRYTHYGYSLVEQAIAAVTAFMYSLAYNASQFNQGTLPKIALAFEEQFDEDQLISLQDQWVANFQGLHGAWRIPMLNGKVNVIDLLKAPRDMEMMKYMEFTGALIGAIFGVDLSEVGLRFQQAQNVLNENVDAKMKFSKDRGLHDLLSSLEDIMNKILRLSIWGDKYCFRFTGLSPEDQANTSKLRKEALESYKTVNEVRAEEDMEPVEGGDIILNPQFMQGKQQDQQAEMMAGEGEDDEYGFDEDEEEDDFGGMASEAVDDVFKAKVRKVKKARTLLK